MVAESAAVSGQTGGIIEYADVPSHGTPSTVILAAGVTTTIGKRRKRSIYDDPSKQTPKRPRRGRDMSRIGNVVAVVMLVAALILSAYIYFLPQEESMTVDGDFSDWDDVSLFMDDDGDAAYSGINLLSTGAVREGDQLFLYVEVIGTMFDTRTVGGSVQVFVDSDASSRSGYSILGIGAEYLVEVYGREDGIVTSNYYRYSDQGFGPEKRDWNWSHISHVPSRVHNRRIEIGMPYHNGDDALLVFRVSDDKGNEDLSNVLPLVHEGKRAPVVISADPLITEGTILSPDSMYDVLDVEFKATGGSCKVRNLTVEVSGTVADTDVGQISLIRDGSAIDSHLLSDGKVVLDMDDVEIIGESSVSIRVTIAPQATEGTVLTMDVADVATNSKAVTNELRGCSWYLAAPPDGYVIDGLFHEWANTTEDVRGDARRNVDITDYKGARSQGKVFFYLGVDGEMMGGAWIPASRPIAIKGGTGSQQDLPLTLPVSNDAAYIFLSVMPADEGYSPEGFPIVANRLIIVTGYLGEVEEARHYRYSDTAPADWPWIADSAPVEAANGHTELEVSVDRDYLDFQVYFHFTTWRNNTGDHTEPMTISGSTGEDDPFALTLNGSAHWSQTGRSWEPITALPEGVEYEDIAAGDDGTVYILQSNGSVLHSVSVDGGWRPFGTGNPGNVADGFVGIASVPDDGSVVTMRMDGRSYRSSSRTDGWHMVTDTEPPGGSSFVDISSNGGDLYALRNDGAVFTTTGSEGWSRYAQDADPGPGQGSVGICTRSDGSDVVISVLTNDGTVHVSEDTGSGWNGLGSAGLPHSASFVDISNSEGSPCVLLADGSVHMYEDGGWEEFGSGDPEIPAGTGYIGLTAGAENELLVQRNDGQVHRCADPTDGWSRFGTGTPAAPVSSRYVDIAADPDGVHALKSDGSVLSSIDGREPWVLLADAGDDSSWRSITSAGTELYVLKADGAVSRISTSDGSVSEWGDAGEDASWSSIATDGTFVYALRLDGMASVRGVSGSSWTAKGDAGNGTSWVSMASSTASPYVYAMDASRAVCKSVGGTNSTWTDWAPSGHGTAWISLAAGEYYVFALNANGTIDRALMATSEWNTSYGTVDAWAMAGMDAVVFEQGDDIPELGLLVPIFAILGIFIARRREQR